MKRVLLNEAAFNSRTSISKKNPNTVEFITVLQECGKSNRNGRIYPREVLEQAINSPYVQERLRTNSFYGEAGHPSDTSVQRQMTIDLKNVAFLIKEMWWEGDLLKGRCETADTAIGRDMKGLIEMGSQVAFSLRAQGNVHNDPITGKVVVESPLNIACYDWVQNPSHDKAFLEKICESTMVSMFRTTDRNNMVALCESENIFNEGLMIDLDEEQEATVIDYTKGYHTNFKRLSEMYIPSENDEILSINEEVSIKSGDVVKKVVLEDFLVKDIRNKIMALTEERERPTVDKNPDDANADLTNEKLYNKEMKPVESEDIKDTENLDNKDIMSESKVDKEPHETNADLENDDFYNKETEPVKTEDVEGIVVEGYNDIDSIHKRNVAMTNTGFDQLHNNRKEFQSKQTSERNKALENAKKLEQNSRQSRTLADAAKNGIGRLVTKVTGNKTKNEELNQERTYELARKTDLHKKAVNTVRDFNKFDKNLNKEAKEKEKEIRKEYGGYMPNGNNMSKKDIVKTNPINIKKNIFGRTVFKESSDYELMQWLDENGYEPTRENLGILREELERGE